MTPNPSSSGVQSTPQLNHADSQQGGSSFSSSNTPAISIPESLSSGGGSSESQSTSPKDLAGLASMQPEQISEILRSNPQLHQMLMSWATTDQAKPLQSS